VTQDAPARLHLVTDNHVVTKEPAPTVEHVEHVGQAVPSARLVSPLVLVAVGAGLTVLLALLGRQPWQLPQRDAGGVSAVPQSLLTFVLLCAVICVWAAGRLVRPAETLRSTAAAHTWWALVAGAALVSLAADLSLASFAGTGQRPTDLLLRCAVPLVPAVLAGVLARSDGRAARIRVALGTGLVTLPLGALGWALLSSPDLSAAGLGDVLAMTGIAGVAPLILAVAFVGADRRGRPASGA
jgi:hypothetical protein